MAISIKRSRMLRLTEKYQRLHPTLPMRGAAPEVGRIALSKRAEYIKNALKIFVGDISLQRMLVNPALDNTDGTRKIIKYILRRTKTKARAAKWIGTLISSTLASKGGSNSYFANEDIEQLAASHKINEPDKLRFHRETEHMAQSALLTFLDRLEDVQRKLER